MNEAHRNVIQRNLRQLANDIILTDDLIGALYQQRIFERNMIEMIKSEKTETDQVYKMLELLPKRGPDAFNSFVSIIENDYPWLAAMLASCQKQENGRVNRIDSYKTDTSSETPKNMVEIPEPEMDIKQRVSVFVHKQFGQSKRISENDKKGMVKWFSQQLQLERKRICTSASSDRSEAIPVPVNTMVDAACGTDEGDPENPQNILNKRAQKILEKLGELKKEDKPRATNVKPGSAMSTTSVDSRIDCITPNSMEIVFEELDYLVNKIDKLESEINKCHIVLGDKDKKMSLSLLIYNMSLNSKQHVKDLNQEKQKSEKMLNEIYDFSKKVTKFEQLGTQQKTLLDQQANEIEKFKEENEKLKSHVQQLEKLLSMHTEKQKTLENLKNMVKELQQDKMSEVSSIRNVSTRTSSERRGSFSRKSVRPGPSFNASKSTRTGTETPQTMFSRKFAITRSPIKRKQGYNPNTNSNKY